MMKIIRQVGGRDIGTAIFLLVSGMTAIAQTTSNWDNASGGNWHEAANWNPADAPDTSLETAVIRKDGVYTVVIDRDRYAGGFTNRQVAIATNAADAASVTTSVVVVNSGVGAELVWQIGTNDLYFSTLGLGPGLQVGRNCGMDLTNVNLVLRGRWANNYTPAAIDVAAGAFFKMKNGRLDIEDNSIYGGLISRGGPLVLDNVALAVERFYVAGGVADINGCTGYIKGACGINGSPATVRDSAIFFNTAFSARNTFAVTNSTLSFVSTYDVGVRANVYYDGPGVNYMEAGSVIAIGSRLWIAGQMAYTKTAPPCEFWVRGASVTNNGPTLLGGWTEGSSSQSRTGNGLFGMTAGTYKSTDMLIGCVITGYVNTGRPDPEGYYLQTGGTSEFSGVITFYSNTNGVDGSGAMRFVVASNSVMALSGPGMARAGNGPWVLDFSSGTNFDTRGAFVFAPSGVETQTLFAFSAETGEDAGMVSNHLAIGILDLRALVAAGKRLDIVPAGNFTSNAVYAGALLMDNPADPGAYFSAGSNSPASKINVYYDQRNSDIRNRHSFSDGHGELIPLNVPRSGAIALDFM